MYDLIIIGGGPAALSAGLYASRFGMENMILGKMLGGTALNAHVIENYPGVKSSEGSELLETFQKQAENFGSKIKESAVKNVKKNSVFSIEMENETYKTKTVILATGRKRRKLGVEGEEKLTGKGVSYCATCDAPLYKDQTVGVIGGSDSAAKEAVLLSKHASKVYIIYRGEEIHPEEIYKKKIEENEKIEVINNANVTKINGDSMVDNVTLDKEYEGNNKLELDGVFVSIGSIPTTSMVEDLNLEFNGGGEIKTDKLTKTNIEGFYAAGDVTDLPYKQVITAASEGVKATHSAYEYLKKEG